MPPDANSDAAFTTSEAIHAPQMTMRADARALAGEGLRAIDAAPPDRRGVDFDATDYIQGLNFYTP